MFKTLKSQVLLTLSAYLIVSAILIVIGNYFYKKKEKISESIQEISKVQMLLLKDIRLMNNFYLYESRNPSFFEAKNSKYLAEHYGLNIRIRRKLNMLEQQPNVLKLKSGKHLLGSIKNNVRDFSDTFYQIALLISTRGYDNYGIEGEINSISDIFKSSPRTKKETAEMIARQEIFLNSANNPNFEKLQEEIKRFELYLNRGYEKNKREILLKTLDEYKLKIAEINELNAKIGVRFDTGLKKKTAELSSKIINDSQLFVNESEAYRDNIFRQMQYGLIILYVLTGALLILLTYKLASKITFRISNVARNISCFVKSDFSANHIFNLKETDDEVGELIKNLKTMHNQLIELLNNFKARVAEQTKELVKQKFEIEQKNEEIQANMDELSLKNHLIEEHLIELKQKNKYILDSINYSKSIQEAILPPKQAILSRLPQSFLLYLPKDIVSGDFYWMKALRIKNKEYTLIAVADCTGHGVPGAFMSMLGVAFLNEIVLRKMIIEPNKILNMLRLYIINSLNSGTNNFSMDDGMDIAVCLIDHETKRLHFSGAKRPLYFVKNNEVSIIKGDNQSICKTGVKRHKFSNHVIDFNDNDTIYMFTDGLTDQFGGPMNKKFHHKRLKDILLSASKKPMKEQKEILYRALQEWKGNYEQLDDIAIIGVKLDFCLYKEKDETKLANSMILNPPLVKN